MGAAVTLWFVVLACLMNPMEAEAAATSLGSANQFAVLSIQSTVSFGGNDSVNAAVVTPAPACPGAVGCPGDTGGSTITVSPGGYLGGDAIASQGRGSGKTPATAITIRLKSSIAGQCVTGGGAIVNGSECAGGTDTTGTNSKVTMLLPNADSDAAAFAQTLAGLAATQTLAPILLSSGQNDTLTTQAGVNVIDLPSLITKGNNKITITAGASDLVVINIGSTSAAGKLQLGSGTQILLSGGITPDRVIFNVADNGNPVAIGTGSVVNGTILAPGHAINAGTGQEANLATNAKGTIINGALIAGQSICIGCKVTICFYPYGGLP